MTNKNTALLRKIAEQRNSTDVEVVAAKVGGQVLAVGTKIGALMLQWRFLKYGFDGFSISSLAF